MTIYTKTMKEALESMYISEDNVAILRDIVKRKSIMTLKFADGKMKVDLFTASAVTQALDKVNPANKAKITKMINTGKKANFMSVAKVVMKSENDPEIEEEEVKVEEVSLLAQQAAIIISKRERERNPRKEEVEIDEAVDKDWTKAVNDLHKKMGASVASGAKGKIIPFVSMNGDTTNVGYTDSKGKKHTIYTTKKKLPKAQSDKMTADIRKKFSEEVELDELVPPSRHVGKSEKNPDMFAVYDQKGKEVKLFKDEDDAKEYAVKNHEALMGHDKPKKEEDDLDEAMLRDRDYEYDEKEGVVKISKNNFAKVKKDSKGTDKSKPTMMVLTKKGTSLVPVKFTEEVELDEALKTTHVIVDTAQGNMVISSAAGGNAEKNLQSSIASAERPPLSIKDKKTLKIVKLKKPVSQKKADDLMGRPLKEEVEESYEYGTDEYAKHTRDVTPGQGKEIDEARPSARRDAMKAMGKRKSDSADDDDYVATADDRKAADKNIIMQLRKATNLGGKYEVTFKDKKKVKVKPEIAMAFIKKFEKMKPVDKAKLQDKGSKSYKDLLKGLKEEDTSILGRIEKKLKEIKNG